MAILDVLLSYLPLISFSIAIIYYAHNVRNANRSRQAGLYIQLWNSFRSPEFVRSLNEVLYHYQLDDYDDYTEKYDVVNNIEASTKINMVMILFESLGRLLRQGFIDVSVIEDQATSVFSQAVWPEPQPMSRTRVSSVGAHISHAQFLADLFRPSSHLIWIARVYGRLSKDFDPTTEPFDTHQI